MWPRRWRGCITGTDKAGTGRSTRRLKPLGKPRQNARKGCAKVELVRLSPNPAWLDKAIWIFDRLGPEASGKQSGKGSEEALAA
jgi:hypothetical protein